MATFSSLLRPLSLRVCAFKHVALDSRLTGHILPCLSSAPSHSLVRLRSTDAPSSSDSIVESEKASTTAADAEKTPVVIDNDLIARMLDEAKGDMPVPDMPDPFQKEYKRCILCIHNLDVNYKNVRLLSQFVSPYTGRIYGRAVTGLCIPMQKRVAREIKKSRRAGFMPFMLKQPEYLRDPRLFDPFRPSKST